jgi:ABC-type protease/lipase transport system fused ATPase/permease subunit
MGMLNAVLDRCRTASLESLHALQRGADRAAISRSLVRSTRVGIQVAVYGVGAWLFLQDQLMVGAIVAASVLLGRALAPLEYVVFAWRSAIGLRQAHRRLNAMLAVRETASLGERSEEDAAHALLDVRRALALAPDTNRVLLNNISLSLSPRELLGVIGPVGAGKSTLGRLMTGLIVPRSGTVLFKGRRFDAARSSLDGASIGYCPQDPQLFAGTVFDNIARFSDGRHIDEVVSAARMVGLHDRIEALPEGYSTVLAPGGNPLSSGMKQQVALARAFFGDPDLVVLDEPAA